MKFGQYELLERIAIGGMAEIYRGRAFGEEGFEKPVAIKRILPNWANDSRFIAMLVQEARIHAALSHRNIVQIHDLGLSEEGEYFIVLEYVDGRDLGALLEALARPPHGARLNDALALTVAIELAEGVHCAHELAGPDGQPEGLVHRDISPSNVLISYAGEVKLSDFGLAKRQADHSVVGSVKGKLAYMSPEQARRWPLDRRSDIFSLGAVLFEMLTGRRLREIGDEADGWRVVASGVIPAPRSLRNDLPHELESLLARSIAPDPRDRFADAREFANEARDALSTVPRARAGEAAELQALMREVLPPGSPRLQTERSRVIRLVSNFVPPARAAAPTNGSKKPAAVPVAVPASVMARAGGLPPAPGMTPPRTPPEVVGDARGLPEDVGAPRPVRPSTPLVSLEAPPQGSGPFAASAGAAVLEAAEPALPPFALPGPATPLPALPGAPAARPAPTSAAAPAPVMAPVRWDPSPTPVLERRPPRRRWPRRLAIGGVVLAALAGGLGALHAWVAPLPILVRWGQPVAVDVTSRPAGASVFVDGRPVEGVTPLRMRLTRDLRAHTIEWRRPGYVAGEAQLRLDRDLHPTAHIALKSVTPARSSRPARTPVALPPVAPLPTATSAGANDRAKARAEHGRRSAAGKAKRGTAHR